MFTVWMTGIASIFVASLLSTVLMLMNAGAETRASENCGFKSGYGVDVACAQLPSSQVLNGPVLAGPRSTRIVMTFVSDPLAVSRQ